MKYVFLPSLLAVLCLLLLQTCAGVKSDRSARADKTEVNKAEGIIQEAIEANGLSDLNEAAFVFRFRDKRYRYQQTAGLFTYERWWTDETSGAEIKDVLTNKGLERRIDGATTELEEKQRSAYGNSVNSVIYFAFLPFVLQDPAVLPKYLGQEEINGELLDIIEIKFAGEGGGEDAGEVYRYWFTPLSRQLKYLAYVEPGDKAPRFRQAHNERTVDGVTIRDYHNYHTPGNTPRSIDSLSRDFDGGKLVLLSEINLEDVRRVPLR